MSSGLGVRSSERKIINMDLVVSIARAREILGDAAKDMSDDEIINTIQTLDALAVDTLKTIQERRKDGKMTLWL